MLYVVTKGLWVLESHLFYGSKNCHTRTIGGDINPSPNVILSLSKVFALPGWNTWSGACIFSSYQTLKFAHIHPSFLSRKS